MDKSELLLAGAYVDALEDQIVSLKAFEKACGSYADAVHNVLLALGQLHGSMLRLYEDNWPKRDVFDLVLADERATWKNLQRDLSVSLEAVLHKYEGYYTETQKSIESKFPGIKHGDLHNNLIQTKKTDDVFDRKTAALLVECPKVIASRVKFVRESFGLIFDVSSKFHKEMIEIEHRALELSEDVPNSQPQVIIGNGEQRVVLSVHNKSH